MREPALMTTFTGKKIDLLSMTPEDIDIVDIGHHLSLVNRFGGASLQPVSVAQHSVCVALLCPPHARLQALLHDATEAYLGDIIHWLKRSRVFAEYRALEGELEVMIWRKFGCPTEMLQEVRDADNLMCRFEASKVMPHLDVPDNWKIDYPPMTEKEKMLIDKFVEPWTPWNWLTARKMFESHYAVVADHHRVG